MLRSVSAAAGGHLIALFCFLYIFSSVVNHPKRFCVPAQSVWILVCVYQLCAGFQEVGELLSNCCHLVPLAQEPLVSKVCLLMFNSVARQQVSELHVKAWSERFQKPSQASEVFVHSANCGHICHTQFQASPFFISFQIVLRTCLGVCVEYVVEGLRICPQWLQGDLLRALAALLYENVAHVSKVRAPGVQGKRKDLPIPNPVEDCICRKFLWHSKK